MISKRWLFFTLIAFLSSLPALALDQLIVRLPDNPVYFDWNHSSTLLDSYVIRALHTTLTELSEDAKPIPNLVLNWKTSPDYRVYTFELKKGIKWSDGTELTAQDCVNGIKRVLDPKETGGYGVYLRDVVGAKDYLDKKSADFSTVGLKAIDRYTFEIKMNLPNVVLPALFSHRAFSPVHPSLANASSDDFKNPAKLIVLGRYKLKSYENNKSIKLVPNPYFFGVKPENELEFRIISDDFTAKDEFKKGNLDFLLDLGTMEQLALIIGGKNEPKISHKQSMATIYLGMNVKAGPASNIHLRKALASAINQEALAKAIENHDVPAKSFIPPGIYGGDFRTSIESNDDLARKEFELYKAEAVGFNNTLRLVSRTGMRAKIAELIKKQLEEKLKIKVELTTAETKVINSVIESGKYDISVAAWYADYPDPTNFLEVFRSGQKVTSYMLNNPKYDSLIDNAYKTSDETLRKEYALVAQKILIEDEVIIVPLIHPRTAVIYQGNIAGFALGRMGLVDFSGAVRYNPSSLMIKKIGRAHRIALLNLD